MKVRRLFTGQSKDTRRLVVAISLSGSAVSFSLTVMEEQNITHIHTQTHTHTNDCSEQQDQRHQANLFKLSQSDTIKVLSLSQKPIRECFGMQKFFLALK